MRPLRLAQFGTALIVSVALAGCTSDTDPSPSPSPTATALSLQPGSEVTAAQAADLPSTQRAYQLQDGRLIVLDLEDRMPASVLEDFTSVASASTVPLPSDLSDSAGIQESIDAGQELIAQLRKTASGNIFLIYQVVGSCDAESEGAAGWAGTGKAGTSAKSCLLWPTQDAAVDGARTYITEQLGEDPTSWTILIQDGKNSRVVE